MIKSYTQCDTNRKKKKPFNIDRRFDRKIKNIEIIEFHTSTLAKQYFNHITFRIKNAGKIYGRISFYFQNDESLLSSILIKSVWVWERDLFSLIFWRAWRFPIYIPFSSKIYFRIRSRAFDHFAVLFFLLSNLIRRLVLFLLVSSLPFNSKLISYIVDSVIW